MSIERLQEIVQNNRTEFYGGMAGALQLAPSIQKAKYQYARNLIEHRNCVEANRKNGREYRGLFWLNRARVWRELAIKMGRSQ